MMANRGRWKPLVYTVVLSGVVLAGVLVYGRFGVHRPGGNPMNESRSLTIVQHDLIVLRTEAGITGCSVAGGGAFQGAAKSRV